MRYVGRVRGRAIERVGVSVALGLAACSNQFDVEIAVEAITLSPAVDVRLEAVTAETGLYVIASGGVVIGQGRGAWDLDHQLHDIVDVAHPCNGDGYLVVVGDEGYIALSDNLLADGPLEFEVQTTPSEADLWAVTGQCQNHDFAAVAAGDEILLVGRGDPQTGYEWIEPTPPPDGWGRLRDVGQSAYATVPMCAVGDAGRVICSEDLEVWERVELDTSENLTALCAGRNLAFAVGEAGTLVWAGQDRFEVEQLQPAIDLLGCSTDLYYLVVIGNDRTVYLDTYIDDELEPHVELDWQPRALDPQLGQILVGDRGNAGRVEVVSGLIPL